MNEPKPFASLGPTLLARKGGAKPAMRPQIAPLGGGAGGAQAAALKQDFDALEDLGWNDMGEDDAPADRSAEVVALTPSPSNPVAEAETDAGSPKPLVRSIHEELAELIEKGANELPLPKPKPKSRPAVETDGGSAKPVVRSIHEELAELIEKGETELPVPRPKPPKPLPKPAPVASRKVRETAEEKAMRRAAFTLRLDAKRHLKLRLASTVKNRSAQQLVTAALDKYLAEIPEVEALAAQVKRN
jgi:hypothetical protein